MPVSKPRVIYQHQFKKRRVAHKRPAAWRKEELSVAQILAWADNYRLRIGRWPTGYTPGPVSPTLCETWSVVDGALRKGQRGLPGGSSIARLLAQYRGTRNIQALPPLTEPEILAWADDHHKRAGQWPNNNSGLISASRGETWLAVDGALRKGLRGLPGGSSLPRLLARHRGVRHPLALPPLAVPQILIWADAHLRRTGRWPNRHSGLIPAAFRETWSAVNTALWDGTRGLPSGSSLARLLAAHRGVRNHMAVPRLSLKQILAWADDHHKRSGKWPTVAGGLISGASGETWVGVQAALRAGLRGLPGGSSLARLLAERRGVRNTHALPPLTTELILTWVDDHHTRTGQWPNRRSGPVFKSPEDNWGAVNAALFHGSRGLPGGCSLARLLAEHRGVRNPAAPPPLTVPQILAWADAHHTRTGQWPKKEFDSPVFESPEENWGAIDAALNQALRGLPAGHTLAPLLAEHRGVRNIQALPLLSSQQILAWADAHRRRTGKWPVAHSGPIAGANEETWVRMETALRSGGRGLPGGSSLARLLAERRGVRNTHALPPLTPELILTWADKHYRRSGKWPNTRSGSVRDAPGEIWLYVETALRQGRRGLPGGSSLIRFLAEHRQAAKGLNSPRYRKR